MKMSGRKLIPHAFACTVILTTLVAVAGEPDYKITRSTFSSGGTTSSSGGDYEMASTIGQSQGNVMEGGEFSVDGGFWYGIASGDCGADGYVDLIDHLQFFDCVTGPDTASVADDCQCYDIDLSGTIDLLDFAEVQAAFTGS
jgi:hypothetical protein